MPQKPRDFQSKPRSAKQKFGGARKFGDKPAFGARKSFGSGDGERRFDKRKEGDRDSAPRPRREYGDRPARAGGDFKKDKPFGKEGGFKKRRFDGEGEGAARPRRAYGDRPARPTGDRPFKKEGGFKKRRPEGEGESSFRPRREFGDGPARPAGDRPFRKEGASRPRRDFGDRPPRAGGDFKRDKPFGKEGGFKKRRFEGEGESSFRPRRDFGDRPPRDNKSFGDKKSFKKKYDDKDFGDKKSFGDKKPFKKYDDRPQKPFKRYDDAAPKKDFGGRLKSDRPSYGAPSSAYLYGIHAVTQALLNPKRVHQRLLCTARGFEALRSAWQEAQQDGITLPEIVTVEKEDIERLLPRDAVHQDVLLDTQPLEESFLSDVLVSTAENAVVLVLDQVTDPHNVGAILRSAAAFGAIGVVVQKLHAPDITGTLAKSASGAVEHVPLIREVNLSRSIEQLKEAGFFCVGLAEQGKDTLAGLKLSGRTALVLGAEGSGLRRLVAEHCDGLAKLPTQEPIASLNVSNAAAVALYELVRAKA